MLHDLSESAYNTASWSKHVQLYVYVDIDDPKSYAQFKYDVTPGEIDPIVIVGHRHKIAKLYNCLATIATGDILMAVNDDCLFRTHGWDDIVRAHMPDDGIAVLYPDDLFHHQCTFPIIGRQWLEATGQFLPECFDWWFSDTWLAQIAGEIDRLIPLPMVLEHLNPMTGKRAEDDTFKHQMRDDCAHIKQDQKTWAETQAMRSQIAERLKELIEKGNRYVG